MSNASSTPTGAVGEPAHFHADSLEASLTAKSLAASVAWYHEVLGFVIDRNYERTGKLIAVSLRAGAVRILISQDDGAKGLDRVKGEGFSLQLTTKENADDLAHRIKHRGGVLESEPVTTPWGARIFRLRDPDGFRWTISSTSAA